MAKLTKTQKQFILLGALLATILIVVIWVSGGGGGGEAVMGTYVPKTVSTRLSEDVFTHPEFSKLKSPVSLPLSPGTAGRDNPFDPIN